MLPVLIILSSRGERRARHAASTGGPVGRVRVLAYRSIVGWFVTLLSCTDLGPSPADDASDDSFVSDPMHVSGAVVGAPTQHLVSDAGSVYIARPIGSHEAGTTALVQHRASGFSVSARIVDGGIDPVSVPAAVGDTIDLAINDGSAVVSFAVAKVPTSRRPRVVRTIPARRKTDVPLNARITIVFSEPMAGTTISSQTIQLMRGTVVVPGVAQFVNPSLDASRVTVEFIPGAQLAANTGYEIVVTTGVQDLDGETLFDEARISFTTGQSLLGPPVSIQTTPDSIFTLALDASYQATAIVRDAAGNAINDRTVSWSSSDPSIVSVTATGLLTAVGPGSAQITASVDEVSRNLQVRVPAGPPATLTITAPSGTVPQEDTTTLIAVVRDAAGRVNPAPSVSWSSSDPLAATLVSAGQPASVKVIGVSQRTVEIVATSGNARGSIPITVEPRVPVASLTLSAPALTLMAEATRQLTATPRDATGRALGRRSISWTSDNASVATVSATGLVTATGNGSAGVTATSEGIQASAAVSVTALAFQSLNAGGWHTCGLTASGEAYCWGADESGQLATDTTTLGYRPNAATPAAVLSGSAFAGLSVGPSHTCGLTALTAPGVAYCWGYNDYGQLGYGWSGPQGCFNGALWFCSVAPIQVTGGLVLASLSAGGSHTCGLTPGADAYCWGFNDVGQIGNGGGGDVWHLDEDVVYAPTLVTGGHKFASVHAGGGHTCGLKQSGLAFCWGTNIYGQLGQTTMDAGFLPVLVTDQVTFASLAVGDDHTCGLTQTGVAYCWGANHLGQLGIGSSDRTVREPKQVSGGHTFTTLVARSHTCGVTTDGTAYCWGSNVDGRLGIGTATGPDQCTPIGTSTPVSCATVPAAVAGGFLFTSITAGGAHTCGLTRQGIAYCWGWNGYGQLGNRNVTPRSIVPVKVGGQQP